MQQPRLYGGGHASCKEALVLDNLLTSVAGMLLVVFAVFVGILVVVFAGFFAEVKR